MVRAGPCPRAARVAQQQQGLAALVRTARPEDEVPYEEVPRRDEVVELEGGPIRKRSAELLRREEDQNVSANVAPWPTQASMDLPGSR